MAFPGWLRKCEITIDSGAAEYDQTDFPYLFTEDILPSEMFDADGSYPALNGGGDIRFSSDADGDVRLSIEVVNFVTDNNPANGKAEIWVKLPTLSNTTGATVYVWYGKSGESQPARDAAYGSEDVWSNGYAAVYHFNEDPSTDDLNDSSANENHGTVYNMEAADLVDGPYGKAWAPDGTDEYVLVPDSSTLEPSSVSLMAVVNLPSSQPSAYAKLVHKGYGTTSPYGSWCLQHENAANAITMQIGRSDGTKKSTATGVNTNTWLQLCGNVYTDARYTNIWVDETSFDSDDHGTGTFQYDAYGMGIFISGEGGGTPWIGQMEELRIMTNGQSEGYMDSTHRTQLEVGTHTTVGTPESNALYITPNGITSGEAFGSLTITTGNVDVEPNGIASGEAWGSPELSVGAVTVEPNGIASEESWGSLTISVGGVIIEPNGIASSEEWGSPVVTAGEAYILAESILSGEAWGIPFIEGLAAIEPNGIESGEAWGTPLVILGSAFILPNGIPSGEAFGEPTIVIIPLQDISPNGIPSAEAWGNPTVSIGQIIQLLGIASGEAFGLPIVSNGILPYGIPSGEAFGEPVVYFGSAYIQPNGIPSEEAFGTPSVVAGTAFVTPSGIPSEEAFGDPSVSVGNVNVTPDGIPSSEAWGTPEIGVGSTYIVPNGIASEEAFGSPTVTVGYIDIAPDGIESGEAWGNPYVTVTGVQISPYSITSAEAWGSLSVNVGSVDITPYSINSEEQWGTPGVEPGGVTITPDGIPSEETFGTINLSMQIQVESIVSDEQWGTPTLSVGPVEINPYGIESQEAWGGPIVRNVLVIELDGAGIPSAEAWGLPIVTAIVLNEFMQMMETDIEDTFINEEEFAISAVYIYKSGIQFTLSVIFDNETLMVDADANVPVISRDPMVIAQTSKFTMAPDKGDKMIINGVRYQVVDHMPDGTGISTLQLHHERTV